MRRREWVGCLLVAGGLLGGCESLPESAAPALTGPQARVDESGLVHSRSKADFFVVTAIDGKDVRHSLYETLVRNHGRGSVMTPVFLSHALPAGRPVKLALMGRTTHASPALSLMGEEYQVKGVVEFTPRENGRYIVRGELEATHGVVWVEDRANDTVVGQKVELKGNTKLGFWDK